jgi:uncharacterized membrane protein
VYSVERIEISKKLDHEYRNMTFVSSAFLDKTQDRTINRPVIVVVAMLVVEVVVATVEIAVLLVNMIPVVVKFAAGVVVLGGCIYCDNIYM